MPFLKDRTKPNPWAKKEQAAKRDGIRKLIADPNGDYYKGEWKNDKEHGHGMKFWKSKNLCYNGQWKNGMRDGYGTLSLIDSGRCLYGGMWKNDMRCGLGHSLYKDKGVYEGNWKDGSMDGYGMMMYEDGSCYKGQWHASMREGHGVMSYKDGSVYEGNWSNDQRKGIGVLKLPDGSYYDGQWLDDMKHGIGMFFFQSTGAEINGVWHRDVPRCGTLQVMRPEVAYAPLSVEIPPCTLEDPQKVIDDAMQFFLKLNRKQM